jgi:hypothetical protein
MKQQAKSYSLHRETVLALCGIQEFPEGIRRVVARKLLLRPGTFTGKRRYIVYYGYSN